MSLGYSAIIPNIINADLSLWARRFSLSTVVDLIFTRLRILEIGISEDICSLVLKI